MGKKTKTSKKFILIDPFANFKVDDEMTYYDEEEAINLEIRRGEAEIVRIEYETDLETNKILVNGFII